MEGLLKRRNIYTMSEYSARLMTKPSRDISNLKQHTFPLDNLLNLMLPIPGLHVIGETHQL